MTDNKMTPSAFSETMNGFDELAIAKRFGDSVENLKGTMGLRSFVFVMKRREKIGDPEAYKMAMELSIKDCMALFADEDETEIEGENESPLEQ